MTRLWLPHGPALWPKGRTLEPRDEAVLPGPRYEGWVTVELIHAATGDVTRRLRFPNLITDAGLVGLGATFTLYDLIYLAVGSGNTAPLVSQTALGGELGRTSFANGQPRTEALGPANAYWSNTFTRLFTESEGNGNIAEIGMFHASSGGVMWMRQLLRDAGGTAIVLTKTAADQLRITYEIRQYWPTADVVTVTTINGVDYTFTMRPCNVLSNTAWGPGGGGVNGMLYTFGADTGGLYTHAVDGSALSSLAGGGLVGTQDDTSTYVQQAYTAPNLYKDYVAVWEPAVANYGTGIGGLMTCLSRGGTQAQVSIAPRIPKLNTQRLTLNLRTTWGRGP